MKTHYARCRLAVLLATLLLLPALGHTESAFGPRIGSTDGEFFLGAQMEFMAKFGALSLLPGFDFGPGTDAASVANVDFRLYLIPLPESGIRFYGQAGPTMMLSGDLELGLSLTLGVTVPMKSTRRYNIEYRWGLGDIPDHKLAFAIMFGL